ncbi:hypothetical protein [Microvirga massiliensis]|nr:hypothetical protein [Microvirga massiliensis]
MQPRLVAASLELIVGTVHAQDTPPQLRITQDTTVTYRFSVEAPKWSAP